MPQVQFSHEGQRYKVTVPDSFLTSPKEEQQAKLLGLVNQNKPSSQSISELPQVDETNEAWEAIKFNFTGGLADTYRGGKQILGLDKEEEEAKQAKINEYMNDPRFGGRATAAYLAGAVLDPAGWLLPASKAKTVGKMAAYGLGMGGIAGATGYVDEKQGSLIGNENMTRAEQTLIGAGGGAVLSPFFGKMMQKAKSLWEPAGEKVWQVLSKNPEPGGGIAGGMIGYQADQDASPEEKQKNLLVGVLAGAGVGGGLRLWNNKIDGGVARAFLVNAGLTDEFRITKGLSKKEFNQIQRELLGLVEKFQGETDGNKKLLYEMLTGDAYDFKKFAEGKSINVEVRDFSGDFVGIEKTTPKLKEKADKGVFTFFEKPKVNPDGSIKKHGTIYFDPVLARQKYSEKVWRNPRTPGVTPLSDDLFPTYWDFERFAKTHEIKHLDNLQEEGESLAAYENRINSLAVEDMNANQFDLRLKKDVDDARLLINKYGKQLTDLGVLSKETFMENYDTYLHRMYKNPEWEMKKMQILRANKVGEIRTIGHELKARGFIKVVPRHDWDVNKDHYSDPKNGWEILQITSGLGADQNVVKIGGKGASKFLDPEFKMDVRSDTGRLDFDQIMVRRDWSDVEKAQMVEVKDAALSFARTAQLLANDISALRFYKVMSEQHGISKAKFDSDPSISVKDVGRVPDQARFGQLRGMYLEKNMHHDIVTMDDWKSGALLNTNFPGAKKVFDSWRMLNGWWKLTKTAYNAPVHMNNFGSNIVMYDLNDGSMKGLRQAFNQLLFPKKRGMSERLKMAQDYDVFGGNYIGNDVLRKNALLYRAYGESAGATGIESLDQLALNMPKTLLKIGKLFKKYSTDKMQELYTWEDNLFRLGLFNTLVDKGIDPAKAAIKAREGFVDYAATSPVLEALRHTALPFVAYAYGIAPRIAESAAKRPWKFAKWAAIFSGLNAIGEDLTNDPEKVKRERVSSSKQKTLFDIPYAPYTNIKVAPQMSMTPPKGEDSSTYANLTRMIPGQMVSSDEMGGFKIAGAPSSIQPSFGAAGAILGPLRGIPTMGTKPIEGWGDKLKEIGRQFVPNLPIPGSGTYAATKLERGMTPGGFTSQFKDTQTRLSSILQTLGVRLEFVEADKMEAREKIRLEQMIRAKESKLRSSAISYDEGQLSGPEWQEIQDEFERDIMEIEKIFERKGI